MRIIGIDPGGTTGLALYDSNTEVLETLALEPIPALEWLEDRLEEPTDIVVCESFHITAETMRKSRGGPMAAIEVIGAARYLTHRTGVPFQLQSPSEAKGFSTNEKLVAVGWKVPHDHQRDAARHVLLAAVRSGAIEPRLVVQV